MDTAGREVRDVVYSVDTRLAQGRDVTFAVYSLAHLLQVRLTRVGAVVSSLVDRLPLLAVVEAHNRPSQVVVNRRRLARQPNRTIDREGPVLRRENQIVCEPVNPLSEHIAGNRRARKKFLHQWPNTSEDFWLGRIRPDNPFSLLEKHSQW